MTALIYSLALGFLIFLSIASRMQISVSSNEQLMNKGAYFQVEVDQRKRLPVEAVESLIRDNLHIIKSHSWVTAPLDNFEGSTIMSTSIDNLVSFRKFPQSVYAIQPNYFETAEDYFMLDFGSEFDHDANFLGPYLGHPMGTGLDFGEQLYTARGS